MKGNSLRDTITIRVHRVAGHAPGDLVTVETDSRGHPLDQSWRRRLRDAKHDHCCEVVTRPAAHEPSAEEPEE